MDKNLKALELDKILEMLAEETASEDAAEAAAKLKPKNTVAEVKYLLEEADAAFVLMAKFGAPSFYGVKNVVSPARRAQAGAGLSMRELLDIAEALRLIASLKQWRQKSAGVQTALDGYFTILAPDKALQEKIYASIKSEEEMADNASHKLADIRRKIINASAGVRDKLDKLIHSQTHQKHLQDAIVTMRSGRFVVPVKAEFRAEIPGLIHDSSASGATVFIEPMAVVEANNEIRVLQAEEKDEIARILLELSSEVGDIADSIVESYEYVVKLDLIFAKAHLAYKMKAVVPKLNDMGRLRMVKARHPLIESEKVVPIDIMLGEDFDTLVITGPNTGGKTVAIKTIGLLTAMAMCGLMIPTEDESEIAVFKRILVDIGDEQSIEQSLSTFSAHMTNIIGILGQADSKSLVLLDELGAGTDPIEGAALATAIIEKLREKEVRLACTTHYAELKAYALQTEGVENGSCEFDVKTLRPTFRLLIGIPGKSNAFAISQRLGIGEDVVSRARELVEEENSKFEDVVGKLEESRRRMESETERVKRERKIAQDSKAEAKRLKDEAENEAQKEIDKARQEAERIVARTRAMADSLLNELEDAKKRRNKELSAEQKAKMRSGLRELDNLANPVRRRKKEDYQLPRALVPGDEVLIYDIDKTATVLDAPKDNTVLVQAGIIKTRVNLDNLRLIGEGKQKAGGAKSQRTVMRSNLSQEVSSEVDIRGENVEEGLMLLDAAIDRAVMRNVKTLTIIHGKGTGVLRSAVHQHLKKHPSIKTFRLGSFGEGEMGVTIAEIK